MCFRAPALAPICQRTSACVWATANIAAPFVRPQNCQKCIGRKVAPTAPRWLNRVVELLESRFRERLTLDEMPHEAGVHPVHVIRAFRQHLDSTPFDFGGAGLSSQPVGCASQNGRWRKSRFTLGSPTRATCAASSKPSP